MRGFLFRHFFRLVFDESKLSESAGAYGSLNPPRSVDWNGCRSPAEMRGFLFSGFLFLFPGKENTRVVFGQGTRAGIEAAFCFFFLGRKTHGMFLATERNGMVHGGTHRAAREQKHTRETADAERGRRTPGEPWAPHGNEVGFGKHGKHRRAGSPAKSRPPPHLPTI